MFFLFQDISSCRIYVFLFLAKNILVPEKNIFPFVVHFFLVKQKKKKNSSNSEHIFQFSFIPVKYFFSISEPHCFIFRPQICLILPHLILFQPHIILSCHSSSYSWKYLPTTFFPIPAQTFLIPAYIIWNIYPL